MRPTPPSGRVGFRSSSAAGAVEFDPAFLNRLGSFGSLVLWVKQWCRGNDFARPEGRGEI